MGDNLLTVLETLRKSTDYLARKGVESPRLNSELLMAHALKCQRLDLYLRFERPLFPPERDALRELIIKRSEGHPLQHLVGEVEFHGRPFATDPRALIPRPETERLAEIILENPSWPAADSGHPPRLLDLGTGSGVLAITLAGEIPHAHVTAADISPDALALTRENATRNNLSERVETIRTDLFSALTGPFHLIAANLPYIPAHEIPALSREVRHDPLLALDGGPDGLHLIRLAIAQAPPFLHPGALLALEIGHDQAPAVCDLLLKQNFRDIRTRKDYSGIERFILAAPPH